MKKILTASLLALATTASFAASTTLTGTVRDFTPGTLSPGTSNPDFQWGISGVVTGMVDSTLTGNAPTPIKFGSSNGYITSAESFAEWFGAAAPSKQLSITLNETAPGSGIYSYANNAFFPINGELLGNYGNTGRNYHFTYQIAATFGYKPNTGQTFTFTGDDDVWVFFDKQLGIDLGGVHGAVSQTVNLDTLFGPGKAEGNYSFDFFFAERHTSESNLRIDTSLQLVPVPEPSTYAMMALGLAGLGFAARRRRERI
jgi:fibro-slime domain-containing protein